MSPRRSQSLIRDVTLMYSLELFHDTDGYGLEPATSPQVWVFFEPSCVLYSPSATAAVGRILERFYD